MSAVPDKLLSPSKSNTFKSLDVNVQLPLATTEKLAKPSTTNGLGNGVPL